MDDTGKIEMTEGAQTRLTPEQLRAVDDAALSLGLSRAAYLRIAVLERTWRDARLRSFLVPR